MILVDAQGKESRELDQGNESGGSATRSPNLRQVPILGPVGYGPTILPLRTPISNRILTNAQAPVSGHADPGLSECNPAST